MSEQKDRDDEDRRKEERIKRNSFCPKSPTGRHKWKAIDGGYACDFCKYFTTEEILVEDT